MACTVTVLLQVGTVELCVDNQWFLKRQNKKTCLFLSLSLCFLSHPGHLFCCVMCLDGIGFPRSVSLSSTLRSARLSCWFVSRRLRFPVDFILIGAVFFEVNAELLKVFGCCWQWPWTSGLFIRGANASDIDSQAILSQEEHTSQSKQLFLFLQCLCKIHPTSLSEIPIKPSSLGFLRKELFLSARWPVTYPRPYWLNMQPLYYLCSCFFFSSVTCCCE